MIKKKKKEKKERMNKKKQEKPECKYTVHAYVMPLRPVEDGSERAHVK